MRIGGSGFGFSSFGGGGGSRSDSFKKGRKPGQKVRGTLIKWVSDKMAWVHIEGHKLLAQLNSTPPVGAHLTFIIKQLHPEVILKEIFEPSSAGVGALNLASSFETARTLFENRFRPLAKQLDRTTRHERLPRLLDLFSSDQKLFAEYLDTAACLQNINHHLDSSKTGVLYYQPWLIPTARRQITLIRPSKSSTNHSSLSEAIMEFDLDKLGMVRAEILYKKPDTGYKLKLQHMNRAQDLKRYLSSRKYAGFLGNIECLGLSKLPQSAHGGILAELMFTATRQT